jgi:virginiamycin B lyase
MLAGFHVVLLQWSLTDKGPFREKGLFLFDEEKPMSIRERKRTWWLRVVGGMLALVLGVATFAGSTLVARAATSSASFTRYDISASGGFAIGITVDKHSNPWFGLGNGSIGTINHRTGALTVYPLANANVGVGTIKVDEDGNVWFTEFNAPGIGVLNPATGKERDFLLPLASRKAGLAPTFLVIDKAENVWFNEVDFSDATGGKLARLSPGGIITEWAVPTVGAEIEEIALDHEGNLWFAEQGNIALNPSPNRVGRLNPHDGTITEYLSPTPNSRPAGIVVAPDDTIWFSEHAADKIAHLFPKRAHGMTMHVTPVKTSVGASRTTQSSVPGAPTNPTTTSETAVTTSSTLTHSPGIVEYSLPHTGSLSNTEDMRFDRHGNLFFEEDATAQIGELILQGDRAHPMVNEWAIPHGIGFYNIEFAPDGTLWISDTAGFGAGGAVFAFVLGG